MILSRRYSSPCISVVKKLRTWKRIFHVLLERCLHGLNTVWSFIEGTFESKWESSYSLRPCDERRRQHKATVKSGTLFPCSIIQSPYSWDGLSHAISIRLVLFRNVVLVSSISFSDSLIFQQKHTCLGAPQNSATTCGFDASKTYRGTATDQKNVANV